MRLSAKNASVTGNPQALAYPHPTAPEPGKTIVVAPGVCWLRMPLPFALDHINLWLLKDNSDWIIVDCGIGNEATQTLWEKIFSAQLGQGKIKQVIATHFHPDHAGNAYWLTNKFNVALWMPQTEFLTAHAVREEAAGYSVKEVIEFFRVNGVNAAVLEQLQQRGNAYRRGVPDFPRRYHRILNQQEIIVDRTSWRIIMGYGHAPEHATLYCKDKKILIAGDMILPRISTNISVLANDPEGNPLKLFLDSLAHYALLPGDTLVLPSHGLPFHGLHERIAQLQQHHQQRLQMVRDACLTDTTAAKIMSVLFNRELDAHQAFFAMGETLAHLNYLMHTGQLLREMKNSIIYYRKAS